MNVHFAVHCEMHLTYSTHHFEILQSHLNCTLSLIGTSCTVFFFSPAHTVTMRPICRKKNICQGVAKKLGCFFFCKRRSSSHGREKEEAIKMAPFFHGPGSAFLPLHHIGAFSSSSSQGRFFRFHLHPSSFSPSPHFSPQVDDEGGGKGEKAPLSSGRALFFSGRPRLTPTLPRKRRREGQLLSNQNSVDRTRKGTNQKQQGGGGATPVCHALPSFLSPPA